MMRSGHPGRTLMVGWIEPLSETRQSEPTLVSRVHSQRQFALR
jgi:hypothetical protein